MLFLNFKKSLNIKMFLTYEMAEKIYPLPKLDSYPTLLYVVLLHLGQGGSVSVSSSRTTTVPQYKHL